MVGRHAKHAEIAAQLQAESLLYFAKYTNFTSADGYESAGLGELFMWSSRAFLLGPFAGTALTLPIFDGGRRKAQLAQARAQFDEDVALYRSQMLRVRPLRGCPEQRKGAP